jgi:hypothetical protein
MNPMTSFPLFNLFPKWCEKVIYVGFNVSCIDMNCRYVELRLVSVSWLVDMCV